MKENTPERPDRMIYDVHSHGNAVLGVVSLINLASFAQQFSNDWVSCGIHPWWLRNDQNTDETWIHWVRTMGSHNRVLAIGECGLDGINGGDMERQIKLFRAQCLLAQQLELPVILHMVRADHLALPLIRSFTSVRFIFHGFSGKWERAVDYLQCGVFLSFGPNVLKLPAALQSLKRCPLDQLFLETDASETSIHDWYEQVAILRECDIEDLYRNMENNFIRVFKRYGQKLA